MNKHYPTIITAVLSNGSTSFGKRIGKYILTYQRQWNKDIQKCSPWIPRHAPLPLQELSSINVSFPIVSSFDVDVLEDDDDTIDWMVSFSDKKSCSNAIRLDMMVPIEVVDDEMVWPQSGNMNANAISTQRPTLIGLTR